LQQAFPGNRYKPEHNQLTNQLNLLDFMTGQ
jgi:hypothetical protein